MARFVGLSRFSLSTLLFAILFLSAGAQAQIPPSTSTTSTPIPGAGHDYLGGVVETVNPVNGSVSFRIPVSMPPGRGITLPFSFAYDSNGVNYMSPNYGVVAGWVSPTSSITSQAGWSESVPVENNGEITWEGIPDGGGHDAACFAFVNYVFQDANGNRHNLDLTTYNETGQANAPCNNGSNWPFGFGALTVTQGGEPDQAILATIDNTNGLSPGPVTVTDGDGTVFQFPVETADVYGVMATSVTDRNGNFITINPPASSGSSYSYIDTAGRTVLQDSGFANSPETVTISGLGAPYKLTWTALPTPSFSTPTTVITGNCGTPGHAAWYSTGYAGNGNDHAISQLTLPNGESFSFLYNSTYGLVSQITYPTGGYIQYTWGMYTQAEAGLYENPQGVICQMLYGVPAITDRYVSFDGSTVALHQQFQYAIPTWVDNDNNYSWTSKQTTVTTTDNVRNTSFTTVYNYSPIPADRPPNSSGGPTQWDPVESSIVYNGTTGSQLETVYKTWETTNLLKSQENTFPSNTGKDSETVWTYNANGMPTYRYDYDFGIGAKGSLLRETETNYATIGSTHIVNKPSSVQIYDSSGTNLVAETDYAYDGYGSSGIASVTATNHDNTDFPPSYTTRGNLTTKTVKCLQSGCANAVTTYTYDETGQILSMTDPCGNGTCSDMPTGATHTTTYSYADSYTSGSSTCTSSNGLEGNTNALLTLITYPPTNGTAHSECFSYNYNSGELTGSKDENRQLTTYLYSDPLARLTQANYPDGGQTGYSYNDSAYNPSASPPTPSVTTTKTITSSLNEVSTTAFDGMNHKVKTILSSDPGGATYTATSYDGNGRTYQVYNPTRCSSITTNCDNETTWGYSTYTYDALGRTTQVAHSDGTSATTSYTGRATSVLDEGNGAAPVQRITQVDGLGRLTSACEVTSATQLGPGGTPAACGQDIAGTGFLTTYTYDALGDLLTVNQGTLGQRSFAYDSLSRLLCAANPETGTATCANPVGYIAGTTGYAYDVNGNLISRTRPAPNQTSTSTTVTTTYAYDALNRFTQKSYSDGVTLAALFGYDQTNITMGSQQFAIANSIGRLSWSCTVLSSGYCNGTMAADSYDPMGRTAEVWQQNPVNSNNIYVSYVYDLLGDETSRNLSGKTYAATYNAIGQLTSFTATDYTDSTNPANLLTGAGYDPFGHLTAATFANGLSQSWAYDNRGRPHAMAVGTTCSAGTCSGSTVYSYSVGYTGDGDVLSATDRVNGTWSYTYDGFNRLATSNCTANCPDGGSTQGFSFGYDRYSNRWNQTVTAGSGPQPSFTFNGAQNNNVPNNRIDGYSYDAAGNLLNDGINGYTYDAENRIISVNSGTAYTYDALDRRVAKNIGGSATDFIYDREGNVILTSPPTPTMIEVNVRGLHLGTYVLNSAGTDTIFYYNHSDWLGTERARASLGGTACETIASLPFGDSQSIAGTCGDVSPNHFTGKERDAESGLDNFGFRYFGSSMGRFMSPDDDSAQDPANPQSWNLYSYVMNQPTTATDPDGHDCIHINTDTGKFEGFDSGDCDNSTEEKANSGIYVDGTINTLQFNSSAGSLDFGYTDANGNVGAGTILGVAQPGPAAPINDPGMIPGMLGPGDLILFSGVKMPSVVTDLFGKLFGSILGKGAEDAAETAAKIVPDVDNLSNKIVRQMVTRGWTKQEILDTVNAGKAFPVVNKATGGAATEYVGASGKFVVVDNATRQVIQVSGPGFLPNH
jgi:RHS repeat-associated protein